MKLSILACLACLVVATPVSHGQTPPSAKRVVIGMPIYTADGEKIGEVTNFATHRGERSIIGEVGQMLGLGTRHVLIPKSLATIQDGRIVLTITSDRVSEVLAKDNK
jgi:sporulation protein YlmC with PRC-barrel domain